MFGVTFVAPVCVVLSNKLCEKLADRPATSLGMNGAQ
jgi:hypothetical protein